MKNKKCYRTRHGTFGFIDDGLEDERIVDNEGNVWTIDVNDPDYDDWEKFKVDEYGDKAMWEYR